MWLERLKVFSYTDNEYYKPKGKFNKNSATHSLAMPNCTTYCFLRMQEAAELTERENKWIRKIGGYGDAKTWYATTTLPKGSEPREGAIAVWDGVNGSAGHVNFVEHIIDSTHAMMSESNYNANKKLRDWHFWQLRKSVGTIVGKSKLAGTGKLLGFIYIPVDDKRVERDESKDQVEITTTMVNVRKGPSTNAEVFSQGLYCPVGIFDVLEWEDYGGNTWAKLDDECWVCCGSSWSKIYKKSGKEELKKELATLKTKKASLEKELASVNERIAEIEEEL